MNINIDHIGFCLGDYDAEVCEDCPSHAECLQLYISDQMILKVDELDPENNKVGC